MIRCSEDNIILRIWFKFDTIKEHEASNFGSDEQKSTP